MAYNPPDTSTAFAFEGHDRNNNNMNYELSPMPETKMPNPLSANWRHDSAIDLFSLNTIMPEMFPLDIPNGMTLDPKDFPVDFITPPPDVSGFGFPNYSGKDAGSCGLVLSDFESDGQLSPKCSTTPQQRHREQTSRRSSLAEITPQDYASQITSPRPASSSRSPSNPKSPRSMSVDSQSSDSPQNPPGHKAAKRAAHNIIEKRYRSNMNAKFGALEKATGDSGMRRQSRSGSASLKKSEILTNAIACMHELQEENKALHMELARLKHNLVDLSAFPRE